MNHNPYNKKERAFFLACAYLGTLFASTVVLWWSVLAGGNPLTFKTSKMVDEQGEVIRMLTPGQSVGVKRLVCSKQEVGVEFFPSLRDKDGLVYPLQSGMFTISEGCQVKSYGFIVPKVPAGQYSYQGTIRFQTNLVGRDEMIVSPEIIVEVVHD